MSKYKHSVRKLLINYFGFGDMTKDEFVSMLQEKSEKRWKPRVDETYYIPNPISIYLATNYVWTNNQQDRLWLKQQLVFKTKKEAMECAKKMLEVIKPTK